MYYLKHHRVTIGAGDLVVFSGQRDPHIIHNVKPCQYPCETSLCENKMQALVSEIGKPFKSWGCLANHVTILMSTKKNTINKCGEV